MRLEYTIINHTRVPKPITREEMVEALGEWNVHQIEVSASIADVKYGNITLHSNAKKLTYEVRQV